MAAQNALKDENSVSSAIFENASVSGETRRGQIDQNTGRILVNATSGVVGPASSTDNAIARWDGTTGLAIQNSLATISDAGLLNTSAFSVAGTPGVDGSFTTVDSKTVTVTKGIITSIV